MDTKKSLEIFEAAKALSFSTLEVTNDAVRLSATIPVDMMRLADKFITLNADTIALAKLIGLQGKPTPIQTPSNRANTIETQSAEFDTLADLLKAYKALPAVVDDDYPAQRSKYEGALQRFIRALRNNGRLTP